MVWRYSNFQIAFQKNEVKLSSSVQFERENSVLLRSMNGRSINSSVKTVELLIPRTEHHLSSFKCGFLNIFSRQNLLRSLSRLLFLLRWNKYGEKKCLKNHIRFENITILCAVTVERRLRIV